MVVLEPDAEIAAGAVPQREPAPLRWDALAPMLALLDGALIVTLGIGCGLVGDLAHLGNAGNFDRHLGFGAAAALLFTTAAHGRDLYLRRAPQQLRAQLAEIASIWTAVCASLAIAGLALGPDRALAQNTVALFFGSGVAALLAVHWSIRRALLGLARAKGFACRRLLLVAQPGQIVPASLGHIIDPRGADICRTVVLPPAADEPAFSQCMAGIVDDARRRSLDEILLAADWSDTGLIDRITAYLGIVPLAVRLVPDPVVGALLARPLVDLGPTRAVELQRAPMSGPQLTAKRLLDLLVTLPLLLVLLPLLLAIAALIAIDSRGPVLFRQRRAGFNGRTFQICKFRTMTSLDDGAVIEQAQRGDGRVTRIGRLLRRFSLDELPQLLNVLKGEMSLVGPRPHALAHDDEYSRLIALYAARHKVKPGITGWAQVNGWRGATPLVQMMMRRVEHDLWYVDHWSLWLDVKILLLTPLSVCGTQNAY